MNSSLLPTTASWEWETCLTLFYNAWYKYKYKYALVNQAQNANNTYDTKKKKKKNP